MFDDPSLSEWPLADESSEEFQKHRKLASKNEAVLLKVYDHFYQFHVDLRKNEKHLEDSLVHAQKLNREKELLDTKLQRGEETNAGLHLESSNLRTQLSDKQNEIPLLAQNAEILKEKFRALQADENGKKTTLEMQHKSVLATKDQYKKCLGCHIRLLKSDDQGRIFVFKFENPVSGSTDTLPPKSAKFSYSLEKEWKLLETNPVLTNLEQLSKKLMDTQDIQGLLAYLHSTFRSQAKRLKGKEN